MYQPRLRWANFLCLPPPTMNDHTGEFDEYRADLLRKLEEKLAAQEQARIDANAAA